MDIGIKNIILKKTELSKKIEMKFKQIEMKFQKINKKSKKFIINNNRKALKNLK